MPVRPLTESEQDLAYGQPVTSWLMLLGASQGFLTHLRFNGLSVSAKNLMPSPFAKMTLPLFMVGGAAIGASLGVSFFGDAQLRRLSESHAQDRLLRTDAALYRSPEKL